MSVVHYSPTPLLDTLADVESLYQQLQDDGKIVITHWLKHCLQDTALPLPTYASDNYRVALQFLYSYRGSPDTFNSYRREIEKFLQWSWFVHGASITKLIVFQKNILTFRSFKIFIESK